MTLPPDPTDDARVPIREAATVVLVRDHAGGGVEVFLQHRVSTMQFAPDMTVFPGGGVEDRDRRARARWRGPDPSWWSAAFGVDRARAESAIRAAVRELFEETGVLLAHPGSEGSPGPAERERLAAGEASLDAVLEEHGMELATDLLRPWDRWTTPAGFPRRYDTLFFLAACPDGILPDGATTEARGTGWMSAAAALEAREEGRLEMLPPTIAVLGSIAEAESVDELLRSERSIRPGGH